MLRIFRGHDGEGKSQLQENAIKTCIAAGYELENQWFDNGLWFRSYTHPTTKRRLLFVARKKETKPTV
jgi:hypothetical protein